MQVTIIPIVIGAFGTVTKGLLNGLEVLEVGQTRGDHPVDSIIENGHNTEKSPGDLRRLAVTQTPLKKPSANADVKNSNEWIIMIIIIVGLWMVRQIIGWITLVIGIIMIAAIIISARITDFNCFPVKNVLQWK